MNEIFYNSVGRLRSGWRFAFFLAAFMFTVLLVSGSLVFILEKLSVGLGENDFTGLLLSSAIGLPLAVLLGWLCGRVFEDLPFRALGVWFTKFWFKDLMFGLAIGAVTLAFAALLGMIFGDLSFRMNQTAGNRAIAATLGTSLVIFILGAAFEEVLIRGYIFQTLIRANLTGLGIVLTSILFASGHLGNPDADYFSAFNTFLAGVWLAVAYLKTRTLWLIFGLHLAWNWFQGAIFGIEVSGLTSMLAAPLLLEIDGGPKWITGENYGIEGGIACTFALLASTVLIWFLPVLKPTEEMYELTSKENPVGKSGSEDV